MPTQPNTWSAYDRGRAGSTGSVGSQTSRIQFADQSPPTERTRLNSPGHQDDWNNTVRKRRSSLSMRVSALTHAGGVNSIENFARSWQRAVGFQDYAPIQGSFAIEGEEPEHVPQPGQSGSRAMSGTQYPSQRRSMLRQQLDLPSTPSKVPEQALIDEEAASVPTLSPKASRASLLASSPGRDIFRHSASGSYSINAARAYGSISSAAFPDRASREQATVLYLEQQHAGIQAPDKEREPLLVKRVEDADGHVHLEVVGQSTIYQTVLNSTNVLIGVGILSLPLAIRYAGWIVGLSFLVTAAITTRWTASLLGKCLEYDSNIITFSDIGYVAYGLKGQIVIGLLFTFELFVACVSLFILFSDSLVLLAPQWGANEFKILCGLISLPLAFVPLRFLGYTSTLGIISCLSIVILVIIGGLVKESAPGSLLQPAATYLIPQHWSTLPLSFGLLMAPWGGHSVFPNIYRDMRHPHKYPKSLWYTFGFTFLLDAGIAVVGLLMYGDDTRDEITSNILSTAGYPPAISLLITICVAIIPITKLPLNARPIFTTIDHVFGLNPRSTTISESNLSPTSGFYRGLAKVTIRVLVTIALVIFAILVPSFDKVMSFMGNAFCFSICVILPVLFYLRLYSSQSSFSERILCWIAVGVSSILAVVGTVWSFLPKDILERMQ